MTWRIMILVSMIHSTSTQWSDVSLSVITGSSSYFPPGSSVGGVKLPTTLTTRYKQPNAYHPNLRFWYTPDVFLRDKVASGSSVSEWQNVANICYNGMPSTSSCSQQKILVGANEANEKLVQNVSMWQPTYQANVLNGWGVVRFSRNNTEGTQGQFLQMETNGQAGFETNPFQQNRYTIFLVVRTHQNVGDTGVMGILNLAESSASNSLASLSLFSSCTSCVNNSGLQGLGCSGTSCPQCEQGRITSFSTLNLEYGEKLDDNSCAAVCSAQGGCSFSSIPTACLDLWGPSGARSYQSSNNWHIVSLRVNGSLAEGFIDGFVASPTPPLSVVNATPPAIQQLRLGVLDQANRASAGFGTIDLAELLIYNESLSLQEMDRVGNYLSGKYGLTQYRVNRDAGSVYRTAAVSKQCGCEVPQYLSFLCNTSVGPYCPLNAQLKTGTCASTDSNIKIITAYKSLPIPVGPAKGQTSGGNVITIQGYYMLPSDVDRQGPSGILGAANLSNIDSTPTDQDTVINSQYLAVSVRQSPSSPETFATACSIVFKAVSGTNNADTLCADWVPPNPIPAIVCIAPPGVGSFQDLTVYWHGVATVQSHSYGYNAPAILSVSPNSVDYHGMTTVTILGRNFGPQQQYQKVLASRYKFTWQAPSQVLVSTRKQLPCQSVTWVSDSKLLCQVPPMPLVRQNVNTQERSVKATLTVQVSNQRNRISLSASLLYTNVPSFYSCNNERATGASSDCFKCCRNFCISDALSTGAPQQGYIYSSCDKTCYSYCSQSSPARPILRRLLQVYSKLRELQKRL